ncbi:MAG: PAS-domain containing protein, partial [Bacteroidales bacterium]
MEIQNKSKEESIIDYVKLKQDFDHVNELYQNDLTERIQVEEELRRSLSLVEATLESTENGILVISNEGQLVKANRRFAELWHISDELIDSRDDNRMLQFIVNQLNEPDFFLAKVRELYANPLAESFDLLYFKDGRIFERFSKPMRVEGQTQARVWSFLDITERTRTETERQVMYEISSAVTATDNLDQMLRQIHQSLKKVVYAENCFVA